MTHPPYGVSYIESKKDINLKIRKEVTIINDDISDQKSYKEFTSKWLTPIKDYLTPANSYYIFNCDLMIFALREALIEQEFKFSQQLIWIKSQAVIGRKDFLPQHELIAYGWYGKHKFYKSKDKTLLFYPKPISNKLHPTMKPIGLLRRLILNSSKIRDIVYDPFGGSGSTMIACEETTEENV